MPLQGLEAAVPGTATDGGVVLMELKDIDEKDLPGRVKLLAQKAWDDLMVAILMEAYEKKMGKKMEKAARLTVDYMMAVQEAMGQNKKVGKPVTEEWVHELLDALVD
jgi:hypothetical protein